MVHGIFGIWMKNIHCLTRKKSIRAADKPGIMPMFSWLSLHDGYQYSYMLWRVPPSLKMSWMSYGIILSRLSTFCIYCIEVGTPFANMDWLSAWISNLNQLQKCGMKLLIHSMMPLNLSHVSKWDLWSYIHHLTGSALLQLMTHPLSSAKP